jgi:hypothetical protein
VLIWNSTGRPAGHHQGADQVVAFLTKLQTLSGGTHRVELHDVIANDDHAVALHATRAERPGKQLQVDAVQVFHLRDGKVTEAWTTHSDTYAFDEFWE